MANARSFTDNDKITDLSEAIENVPNQWDVIASLGMFQTELRTQKTISFDETFDRTPLLEDTPYDERAVYDRQTDRNTHVLAIPHFTFDARIKKSEINGRRADGSDQEETILNVQQGVVTRAKRAYEQGLEYSRAVLMTTGDVYSPNGTVNHNIFTEYNVTQKVVNYDFAGTPDLIEKGTEALEHIQDNLFTGRVVGRFVALCSPTFFASLLKDDGVKEAYNFYENTNQLGGRQVLRDRLNRETDMRVRQFNHGGVEYIEYRGSIQDKNNNVLPFIPADEGVMFSPEADIYRTFYAPADIFDEDITRTLYTFEERGRRVWEYESESNFANWIDRPATIVKLTSA